MKSRFEFHGEVKKVINGTTIFLAPRTLRDTAEVPPTGSRGRRKRRQQPAFPQRWKMIVLASVASAAAAALVTSWVLADAPLSDCEWDGHTYSIGAIMHAYESDTFECVLDPHEHRDPYWVPGT
ncbi:hypothetical protein [Ralstonia pseudosolanacearum]|uniref:hypothetical protein n=1 Tax=Ralstonia pseudosolanacearum TaxID=1310165 RepID=UPI0011B691D4|nr:hypothetical protein [Ralstonia pseudosolanacearum]